MLPASIPTSSRFVVFILFCVTAMPLLTCDRKLSNRASQPSLNNSADTAVKTNSRVSLRGEEAIRHLKEQGTYDSLAEAMAQASYSIKRANHTLIPTNRAYEAVNVAQSLCAYFSDTAMHLLPSGNEQRDWKVGVKLKGFGYGDTLLPVTSGEMKASGSRIQLTRYLEIFAKPHEKQSAIVEWYVNKAEGLEQGFTLSAPPGAQANGKRLRLTLELTGSLRGEATATGQAVLLKDRRGNRVLSYDKLKAWDATDRELAATMQMRGRELTLEVDDTGANYPITIDPVWSQQAKLTASDGTANDIFGQSVAISGETAIVGVPSAKVGANTGQGAAYVFVRVGTTWSQQQKLTASDGAADNGFGVSVAIDGETAIVGARGAKVGTNFAQGASYVFVRVGTTWSQQQKLTADDGGTGDNFGRSVAISGETAIVGALNAKVGANADQGAAYVFVRSGTIWSQQQKLTASDGAAGDGFGESAAISGETAIVGAEGVSGQQGAAYVFVRLGTTWSQQQKLTASDGSPSSFFGFSVAISGETSIVGARGHGQGAAYVFVRVDTTWSQQQKLTPGDAAADEFGVSVAISGETAIVGADTTDVGANGAQGAAYVFVRSGTIWSQQQKVTASDGAAFDEFGISVAIGGMAAIVGAFHAQVGANAVQGAAYVFVRSTTVTVINTNDSGNDSLRLAITIANANPGTTIAFNIPTSDPGFSGGVFTIKPLSPLPTITGNGTIIDGTTQTAFTGDTNPLGPEIVINGLMAGNSNGLFIAARNCVVRGLVINGFGVEQVVIQGSGAKGNELRGCYINTDPTGSFSAANPIPFPGGTDGVEIDGGAQSNVIGGIGPGEGNVISGNLGSGVFISDSATSGNLIQGNLIGLNATGTGSLPNGESGVVCQADTHDNVIGGTIQGAANLIAFNGFVGALMDGGGTINNGVRGNSVFSNHQLGISLGTVVSPNSNDHCDLDTGPNNLQNYPVLSSAVVIGNTINIAGTLDSAPNQAFAIDLFASPVCSASGFGEGKTYLGSTTASTDSTCTGAFSVSLPYQPSDGTVITATATDSANNTSEFSQCLAVDTPPVARCQNVTVSAGPNCTANASIDNGSFDPDKGDTITLSQSPSGPYALGATTVTLTVTDNHGLSSQCQATVTVVDTTPPTITCPPNKTQSTDPGQCSAVVTYAAPAVTDNCSCNGAGSAKKSVQTFCRPVCNPPSGATFPKGTTTVACSVSDASGNQNSCSFNVTVNDTQPPLFPNGCSAPVSVAAASACPIGTSTVVSYVTPAATDNCPGVRVTCSPPSGSTFPLGTTTVTCTATDTSGNTAQCNFTVTVFSFCLQDETNPGNFVLVNAITGDYIFFCNGSPVANGRGTLTIRACIGSIDQTKGDRRVHIQWDTTAASGEGSGTAIVQVGPNKTVCQITDRNMSNNTCSSQPQAPALRLKTGNARTNN